ncbi:MULTISPECIES: YidB family protein [unclassified Acinetobacter]|uniref:YidB family protein n=1 Tax=unclassified Acinetobacter TaxID=196816 RepID=UPI0035B9D336
MSALNGLIEGLVKQALGGQQQQQAPQSSGGLGDILGAVLGGQQQQQQNTGLGGLGNVLGAVLGGQQQQQQNSGLGGLGALTGLLGGNGGKAAILMAVLPLVLGWIQKQGGVNGAVSKLSDAGLASQAQSWVSPEQTCDSVQGCDVQPLFDDQEVEQVAQQVQQPKSEVYNTIASVLPQIIDTLTPQGNQSNTQTANNDIQNVLSSLSGLMGK